MNYVNNATLIRRELIIRLSRLLFDNKATDIDRIPVEMFPKSARSVRCCIHKDRAVSKYRLMALLGHRIEEETDELKPLSDYYNEATERDTVEQPVLTVIDEACSSCIKGNYFVSNACQGCVARPCMLNCKRDAVSMVDGHAKINTEKCVNCGICMKECPYHAIIYMPVPCEEACPVNAISKDEHGKEKIDFDKCTFCGKCMKECPFGAIMERSQIVDVLKSFNSENKIIAMIAPSIVGQFAAELEQVVSAIKQLGFDDVIEVAYGADITAAQETEEFVERMEQGDSFMTTSCCPAYTETVKKHLPELAANVSDTPTPMAITAKYVDETMPDALKVFIGPCVAKRHEALNDPHVDYVLSFEELGALFVAKDIDVQKVEAMNPVQRGERNGRGFAASGGVTDAIKNTANNAVEIEPVLIDGLTKKSIRQLKGFTRECPGNFVEVMACEGGCMAGPCVVCNPKIANRSLQKLLAKTEKETEFVANSV
jgi:[FeFe] hydrogenase (group B1/B3)